MIEVPLKWAHHRWLPVGIETGCHCVFRIFIGSGGEKHIPDGGNSRDRFRSMAEKPAA